MPGQGRAVEKFDHLRAVVLRVNSQHLLKQLPMEQATLSPPVRQPPPSNPQTGPALERPMREGLTFASVCVVRK